MSHYKANNAPNSIPSVCPSVSLSVCYIVPVSGGVYADPVPRRLDDRKALFDDWNGVRMTRQQDRVFDLRQLVQIVLTLHKLRLDRLHDKRTHAHT